tara:strand:+ start:96 stop:866 length:771 start_codon:yes stop_codon:yes gene_type:complete
MFREFITFLKDVKRFFMDTQAYFTFNIFYKKNIKKESNKKLSEGVTVVITSCGRPKHLEEMLISFQMFNTYDISKVILVEDAGCYESKKIAESIIPKDMLHIIFHEKNKGQMTSIDEAYAEVKTEYIFHIEEDWLFIDYSFIETSLEIINLDSSIGYVCLRPLQDYSMFKFEDSECKNFKLFKKRNLIWNGIFLNPGIYRTANYIAIGKYENLKKERNLIQAYNHLGLRGALSNNTNGFVIHNGEGSSTRLKYKVG